jgi:hypothetical protein
LAGAGRLSRKMGVKKEKQLWTSHRCFPGCVLEVVCLIRRSKYEMVALIRKILDYFGGLSVFSRRANRASFGTRVPVGQPPLVVLGECSQARFDAFIRKIQEDSQESLSYQTLVK